MKTTTTITTDGISIGTRVRESDSALRHARDYYLSQGQPTLRSNAQADYERRRARRGTVQDTILADYKRGVGDGYLIQWDDGGSSRCLRYMVSKA